MNTHASRLDVTPRAPRPTTWLASTVIGIYALIVIGAVTALAPAATACQGWPTCDGYWIVPFTNLSRAIAWSHRLATLVVGVMLGVAALTVLQSAQRRVRAAVLGAVGLFPIQIGVGAVTAGNATTPVVAVHLALAMTLFSLVLVALAWQLEATTPSESTDLDRMREDVTQTESGSPWTSMGAEQEFITRVQAYLQLTKPTLMWLLCLVALASMALVAGPSLAPGTVLPTLAGGVLAIGASGTFNNVLEREADEQMDRTADRPLPRERIPVRNAVGFGIILTIASLATFLIFVNVLAAALSFLAILYYSLIYTLVLKPHTDQNIVIGGAVGAFPALIGWAALTGTIGLPALLLGTVIFLWTPAHFYNLALVYKEDYAAGGFPMLPVVRGDVTTRKHILLYLGTTLLAAAALGTFAALGWLYAIATIVLGGVFLWTVVRLHHERTDAAAFRAFHSANAYLGTLLLAIIADATLV